MPYRVAVCLLSVGLAAQGWKKDLVFHANFDGGLEAKVAAGDKRLYSAPSYKEQRNAKPGLEGTDVELVNGAGRKGGALRFKTKNTKAVFYKTEGNLPFDGKNWAGTISFWLKLNPDEDLAPGFCDPIQVTDKAYNDSAIWVDFTKDDKPRHFRLGVFGALKEWNPKNLEPDKNPDFNNRLVVVKQAPFSRERWTHVAITHERLGSGKGAATLYLDGKSQGVTPSIGEGFQWDAALGALRLGVNYVGLMDDVAVFRRALTAKEVAGLGRL
ncbi:MAG: LamG domain-containing protein [Acidobacteria bacterium]|nr:LamG domain-containing protein [Acidobacteriota bacterium]